jgi:hypothetical protein
MYFCNECLFSTKLKHNYERHCLTKKHIVLLNKKGKPNYFCSDCDKDYKHQSSFSRHKKICNGNKKPNNTREINTNSNISNLELKLIKKDYEHKLEIEKLKYKNQLEKKELEKQLEIKEIENKNLQLINDSKNKKITNKINVEINNINICKLKYLNSNFSNVIDINTFIENYKTKFGLTNEQSLTLLENSQEGGINSCISSLVYYLKDSAIKQYKEIKGQEIARNDVVLPFLLSDKSLRDHFEKSINGKWDKTTMNDNIKKIVTITNDHVFKHHKQFINISGHQNKRLMNGILKASCYSLLSNITDPELYKITGENNNSSIIDSEDNNILEDSNDINNQDNYDSDSDEEYNSDEDEYNSEEYNSDDDM